MQDAITLAEKKAALSITDMLIRGALSGVFLGFATSLAVVVTAQGLPPIVGAILFPVGFVMLALLGLELATGNFAILPAGLAAGSVPFGKLIRNWSWVYVGNLLGSVLYAYLFYVAVTDFGHISSGKVGDLLKAAAQAKTLWLHVSWCKWMVGGTYQRRSVQLDGHDRRCPRAGFAINDWESRGHVAADPDVFRPRV